MVIFGLGCVFEDKLYFTKDVVDESSTPKNKKPNTIPNLQPRPLQSLPEKESMCNYLR